MKCSEHPNREAVATCSICGNGVCTTCRSVNQTETLCPDCMEKQHGLTHYVSTPATDTSDPRRLGKKRNLVAFILIIALYSLTLWSYLSPWRGGAISVSAISAIAVSLILQLALLWRDSVLTRSVTVIAALINLTLLIFYVSLFVDSTSMIGVACMIILIPIVLTVTLYDVVSAETLIGILLITWFLLVVLLAITSNLFWTSALSGN
jgi:hypothetical protein